MLDLGCCHTKIGVDVLPHRENISATGTNSKSSQMDSKSSVASSASSKGRSKIALKPGRSLMDWIRLTHSGKDLALTGGKCLEVSSHELSKHNTMKDAWISLKGNVYNITYYLEYHPGGEEELMRGAGRDATDLFNKVHPWVNAESMLQKCFVGVMKRSWSLNVSNLSIGNRKLKPKKTAVVPDSISTLSTLPHDAVKDVQQNIYTSKTHWPVIPVDHKESDKATLKFQEDESYIKLRIEIASMLYPALITDLVNRMMFIKLNKYMDSQLYTVEFPILVKQNYNVNIPFGERFLEVLLSKMTISCKSPITWTPCEQIDTYIYWPCKLMSKTIVNYNTYLFTFLIPEGKRMWIPIGGHVNVKYDINGEEVIRSYTPVIPFCDDTHQRKIYEYGHYIALMIKIYPDGALTSVINQCNIGDKIKISHYCYTFSEAVLLNCDSVVMFAAGTGLTPMINIIHWVIKAKDKQRSLLLLLFNKREEDILWQKELDQCCRTYKFQVIHILSEAPEKLCSFSGKINTELVKKLSSVISIQNNPYMFVCGPLPFTETTLRCLQAAEYNMDHVHAFTG